MKEGIPFPWWRTWGFTAVIRWTRRNTGYDAAGSRTWYHDYYYDAQGRKERVEAYDGSGQQIGVGEYLYNEQGNAVQAWGWLDATGLLMKEIIEYDGDGRRTSFEHYDETGKFSSRYEE